MAITDAEAAETIDRMSWHVIRRCGLPSSSIISRGDLVGEAWVTRMRRPDAGTMRLYGSMMDAVDRAITVASREIPTDLPDVTAPPVDLVGLADAIGLRSMLSGTRLDIFDGLASGMMASEVARSLGYSDAYVSIVRKEWRT